MWTLFNLIKLLSNSKNNYMNGNRLFAINSTIYSLVRRLSRIVTPSATTFLRGESSHQIALIFDRFVKNERLYGVIGRLREHRMKIHIRPTSIILIHAWYSQSLSIRPADNPDRYSSGTEPFSSRLGRCVEDYAGFLKHENDFIVERKGTSGRLG